MWLVSGAPEDPEGDAGMKKHDAAALNSTVNSIMHVSRTENEAVQLHAVYEMIHIAKPWTMSR
jgi:hypothetical protein